MKALFLFAGLGGYAYPFYQSGEYENSVRYGDYTFMQDFCDKWELIGEMENKGE
ncbi:MAG: hypothetical protein LBH98_00745 [Chitinispirillales bacterium]|jgi:hypothetical protein|nr:hypothetical protein [Chitinispirillales bacterium]